MKIILSLLFSFISFNCISQMLVDTTYTNIVDKINNSKSEQSGKVSIIQDRSITNLLGHRKEIFLNEDSIKCYSMPGFRIQIYSDNSQRKAKIEANKRLEDIKEFFPEQATYLFYKAPFWKLIIGNYVTHYEAEKVLKRIKRQFPRYSREVSIISTEINIPIERNDR